MAETQQQEVKRSVLHESQGGIGASFTISQGWNMAECYSDPKQEHLSVRSSGGVVDLFHFGSIKVGGGEAVQFLNGLVTNNVKTLEPGKGMAAAILSGHGKVKALCRVLNLGDEYLVLNDPQTHEKVFKYLFPFSYAGDFRVEDVSEDYRMISVQGPKAPLVMKEICFEPLPALTEYDWFRTLIAGQDAVVTAASHTGELGFDILVPSLAVKDVWDFILLKGDFHSVSPFGLLALESLRIEAGIPVYGQDVDETNMMLEVGLDDAVSLNKGCYTGQEAVAMATYRGHISKKLSGLAIADSLVPSHGDVVIQDDKEIGLVTSALHSPTLGSVVALAYIKYGFFESDTSVEVKIGTERIPALVVDLPFYTRS